MRLISDDVMGISTIWQESRGESYRGKVMVGEVIRNRTKLKFSSDGTVAGTVTWPYQFSGWIFKDPNFRPSFKLDDEDPVVAECIRAWVDSEGTNYAAGATHYVNLSITKPFWTRLMTQVAQEDHHTFFK